MAALAGVSRPRDRSDSQLSHPLATERHCCGSARLRRPKGTFATTRLHANAGEWSGSNSTIETFSVVRRVRSLQAPRSVQMNPQTPVSNRWLAPAQPAEERKRLEALHRLQVLDTPPEERFDRITRLTRALLDVPIVLVSLVDAERQWFKSRQGLDVTETPRQVSFCGHAILHDVPMVVEDATDDDRFEGNPLVVGASRALLRGGSDQVSRRLQRGHAVRDRPHSVARTAFCERRGSNHPEKSRFRVPELDYDRR